MLLKTLCVWFSDLQQSPRNALGIILRLEHITELMLTPVGEQDSGLCLLRSGHAQNPMLLPPRASLVRIHQRRTLQRCAA